MPRRPNPEMADDENPVWDAADLVRAKSFSELPESHQRRLKPSTATGANGNVAAKRQVSVQLPREVVDQLQSTGEGWRLRMEEALREWLARQAKRRKVAS